MNIEVVKSLLESPLKRALFGAALLLANEGGVTIAELSAQLGISKKSIKQYTRTARARRMWNPRAFLVYSRLISEGCDHSQLWGPGLRICLDCLTTNQPGHPALRRHWSTDPKPEPSKVYVPGTLKGGK